MKWIIGLLMVWSALLSDVIAVASDGNNLKSSISSQASRCDYYIFIDNKDRTYTSKDSRKYIDKFPYMPDHKFIRKLK